MKMIDTDWVYDSTMGRWLPRKESEEDVKRLLLEESEESASSQASKLFNMTSEELMTNVVLAVLGCLALLIAVALLFVCYKYLYHRLPKRLKSLLDIVKKKLMWNSILRYSAQKYLSTSI